jgi:hypothetical protein
MSGQEKVQPRFRIPFFAGELQLNRIITIGSIFLSIQLPDLFLDPQPLRYGQTLRQVGSETGNSGDCPLPAPSEKDWECPLYLEYYEAMHGMDRRLTAEIVISCKR